MLHGLLMALMAGCRSATPAPTPQPLPMMTSPATYAEAGDQAAWTLRSVFYDGSGAWRTCDSQACPRTDQDWGADAATDALYVRWASTHDATLKPIFAALAANAPTYGTPCDTARCPSWSDVPVWDAIASMREFEVLGRDAAALQRAEAAFHFVDAAKVFAIGACSPIHYQVAGGRPGYMLKTLETDANYIKAALLLYQATYDRAYLAAAQRQYVAVRRYFLDPRMPLYSVYVFDDGRRCTQLPHRFFASVNGDMIWNGVMLSRATGAQAYRVQALETAHAVDTSLSDPFGVYADLQAENDVAEPLVEAMWVLAREEHQRFAFLWLVRNATAALNARLPDGAFDRFWDGPPSPAGVVSIWRSNGGLALEMAAASVLGKDAVERSRGWAGSHFVRRPLNSLPSQIAFNGGGFALIGTQGERCCEPGHARVFIDGVETTDETGIWQNKSMVGSVPTSVLFAWRWAANGHHTIRFEPGAFNPKEGGAFLHADGYVVEVLH